MAAELIATTATKKVYRDGDKAIKVFNADFPKAEVLNEALITARVEETGGIDVPKVLEVGVFEGKWSITFDFIEGKTLQQLMDENPDKLAEYMEQMVDLHLNILSKHCPLLNKLKDKMSRQILEIDELSDITRYDMRTKLDRYWKSVYLKVSGPLRLTSLKAKPSSSLWTRTLTSLQSTWNRWLIFI